MTLPVTVEYGALLWKLAAVVVALAGIAATRLVRGRRARRGARAEVARRMVGVTAPVLARVEGVATVTGILRGGIASTLELGGHGFCDRAGELYVDYKGERVELAAPVRVVHGTLATASRGLPRATPAALRALVARSIDAGSRVSRVLRRAAGGRVHRLAQVRDGDAVIVRGTFGKRGGVDRFGVRTWLLEPEPGAHQIELCAVSPAAPVVPLRWYGALLVAVVLAAGACAAMSAIGMRALAAGRADAPADPAAAPAELGAFDPLALAAALPGTRADALDELARRYPALRQAIDQLR